MGLLTLPKKFYSEESNPLHIAGYTLALGMMFVGVAETVEGAYYYLKRGNSNMLLGPLGIVAGGYMAYAYLNEAGVAKGY